MSLKWAVFGFFVTLVLAVVFLQQHVPAVAIAFAMAAGYIGNEGWRAYRAQHWT